MDGSVSVMTIQTNYALTALLLRLLVAATLLPFGIKKVVEREKLKNNFPSVMGLSSQLSFYLAAFAETVAPICLIFGFFTRVAALGGILNMGLAYYTYIHFPKHKEDPYYYAPSLPILLGYIAVLITGPGVCSLDYFIF